jgi:23S rRNA (uracil1939-C5)-methyltransferase
MTIIEQGKCKIKHLNTEGLGVSHTKGGAVELPYTLPGEIIEFERHKYRGKINCILKKTVHESRERILPVCKYFGACGGCSLQHMQGEDYVKFKINLIESLLEQAQITTTLKPFIAVPFGNRRRASLKVLKKNDNIYLGFHRARSHQIINIDECPAILKNLSELLIPLKQLCYLILENSQKVELLLCQAANGVHLQLITKDCISLSVAQAGELAKFAVDNNIIQVVTQTDKFKEIIYQSSKPYVEFDDKMVEIEPSSFLQTSKLSDTIFKDLVLDFLGRVTHTKPKIVIDLFCGRGTFALPLAKYFNVEGFESDLSSVQALNKTISTYNLSANAKCHDLFTNPVLTESLNLYDYAVINPPRVGAQAQCSELAKSNIEKVAYISCKPQSFVSDAQILIDGGYALTAITPVDQFPMTSHLEIVASFEKR